MPTEKKEHVVDELSEKLATSSAAIITDYRGLSVSQMADLRNRLRQQGVEYAVAKNTLTALAAKKARVEVIEPVLEGPTAIAFVKDDPVAAAKAILDFARTSKILSVKGALLQGKLINAGQVEQLATLPPREVLIGRVLGQVQAPLYGLVGVLSGPARSFAYLLQARIDQLNAEQAA
jgi:large subunit ribosomal protein L10